MRRSAYLTYDTDKEDDSGALVVRSATPSPTPRAIVPRSPVPQWDYTTKTIFGHSQPHVAGSSWALDNTSYILVNDASEFVPSSVGLGNAQASTEPVIGFLIPAASFNLTNCDPDDVVEIVCGVRNAKVVPRRVLAESLH